MIPEQAGRTAAPKNNTSHNSATTSYMFPTNVIGVANAQPINPTYIFIKLVIKYNKLTNTNIIYLPNIVHSSRAATLCFAPLYPPHLSIAHPPKNTPEVGADAAHNMNSEFTSGRGACSASNK